MEKVPLGKGLIPEPESIYIFSKQSIVPALTCMQVYHLLCNGLELSRQLDVKENYPIWNIVVFEERKRREKKLISYAKETLLLDVLSVPILVLPLTTLLQVFA